MKWDSCCVKYILIEWFDLNKVLTGKIAKQHIQEPNKDLIDELG